MLVCMPALCEWNEGRFASVGEQTLAFLLTILCGIYLSFGAMMRVIHRSFKLFFVVLLAWHLSLAAAQLNKQIGDAYAFNQNIDALNNALPLDRSVRSATGITLSDSARSALRGAAIAAQPLSLNAAEPITLRAPIDASTSVNLIFTAMRLLDAKKPALGYQAIGFVEGAAQSSVTWVERAGVVSAIMQLPDKQLQIRSTPLNSDSVAMTKSPSISAKRDSSQPASQESYLLVNIDQRQFRDHPITSFAQETASFLAAGKHRLNAMGSEAHSPVKIPASKAVGHATASQALAEDASVVIDVLIVYTAAAERAIGGAAAMDSHLSLAIAQTNQAYALSGAKQQLRLVHSQEVNYAETGDLNIDLGVLRTNGDTTLDEVHFLRDAYGADIVSLWVEDGGSGCGLGLQMSTVGAYFAGSAFNVVARRCAVGNYTFAHELGHNMGLRHDPFVDQDATPYAFGHGFVDVANKFRTIMAYEDACIAANTYCTRIGQFSSAIAKYGQFATGNVAVANAAAALNATRPTVAAFKTAIDPTSGGTIQFSPQSYGVIEGATVALKVSRLGASEGVVSVRYLASSQTATLNNDFRSSSGTLVWRDGEDGEKIILIDTALDTANEGTEKFKVDLVDFVGATPLMNSINGGSTATVDIFDSAADTFPVDCTLPSQGWSTPATATTGWGVGRDSSTEGGCSLKSNPMLSVGNSTRAQLQFEGEFTAGVVSFDRRVFSEQGFDCFRFRIDGIAVELRGTCDHMGGVGISGNLDWSRIEVPISAGRHTLLWSYEKDGNTSVGGDAAWIDRLSLPLPPQLARLDVQRLGSTSSTVTSAGNVFAQTVGLNCGTICSSSTLTGSVVVLTAIPDVASILVGWSVNGVAVCPVEPNSPTSFNGGQCALTIANSTLAVVSFGPRPLRTNTTIKIVTSPAATTMAAAITLQISVAGNSPSGLVDVRRVSSAAIDTICANVSLASGQALCSVPSNSQAVGINLYQVIYAGDAANNAAQETIGHFIAGGDANAAASVTLSMEPAAPRVGQNIKITALVITTASPADNPLPQGVVRFLDSTGKVICIASALLPISSASALATASCSFAATAAQTITAHYALGIMAADVASASLSYAVGTNQAPDYTDMWWAGESQNGWGMSIVQHGNTQFNVLYVYDTAGKPIWVVMPGGSWNTAFTEYSGAVYQPTSAPYYASASLPFTVGKPVGNVALTFSSLQTAVLRYTINGISGTKNIQRQSFGGARTDEAVRGRLPVGDLWWGGVAENGWGINIAQQGTTLFGVWYTYDNLGNTTWMVLPGGTWQDNAYSGNLYTTTANAWLGNGYNAASLRVNAVGSLRIEFLNADAALMRVELPAQNFRQSKIILRQQF